MQFATQYRQIARKSARATVRQLSLSALAAWNSMSGGEAVALRKPRVQFLYLHHVFADEELGFAALLQAIQREHAIIPHSDALRRMQNGEMDKPYVAISFDDGIKNCMTAARLLESAGATACFFVCPSIVGEKDENKVGEFCRSRLSLRAPVDFMDWRDLEALKKAGHEIGSHSMHHANLAQTGGEQLTEETAAARAALEKNLGPTTHFAWPYGTFAHFGREAKQAVFAAGYASCASAVRGCHVAAASGRREELCIRRDHVVAAWPLSHSLYFMAKSSQRASEADNEWPAELKAGNE